MHRATPLPPPTDTPTLVPTNTPLPTPTDTPTPIPTDTPTPTDTPDWAATEAVQATQTAEAMSAEVKAQMEALGIPADIGSLAWVQDKAVVLENTGYRQRVYGPFAEGIKAADYVVKVDITWNAPSFVGCGLIMRSNNSAGEESDHANFYRFYYQRFSGLPGWHISWYENGEWQYYVTGKWRYADAIDDSMVATNRFVIVAESNQFTVYINGERIGRYFDDGKRAASGYFGTIIYQDTGESTCIFENGWIWTYK